MNWHSTTKSTKVVSLDSSRYMV